MMTIRQYWLTKLAEECCEVGQRALKSMQFGGEQVWKAGEVPGSRTVVPNEGLNNAQRLRLEINDLLTVLDVLDVFGEVSRVTDEQLHEAKAAKLIKIHKYLKMSQDLGLVEKE